MKGSIDFEKLGVFYLGRPWDLRAKTPKDGLLLYDSKDLVTHAVCVGMTGSGKTGLCLALLEEAAIDGIPALVIDPKGDLPNLMLTFPDLRPEDFAPWVNPDDARTHGQSVAAYGREQAERWRTGLAAWGEDGARIRRLREAAEVAIYTPGSEAGIPVSILESFAAPPAPVRGDPEALRERVATTTTSLLGLLGVEADPVKSREHILISTILAAAWTHGQDLDLAALIQQIQTPPVTKVGVLDLETFYPAQDRFDLATDLNNLLAAPGFAAWMHGVPLDVGQLLRTPAGTPRVAIFSIAHLPDRERMFFVSLLLNQVLGWMRTQSGTTSLRAIVYMDEIFGYFPPVATPPSKLPLLTLLKQARAFGIGIVLATQNPVDLDYKGLANAGTWFIGRLQTERDRARVLDGLEGAAAAAPGGFDRRAMEQIIAGLGQRIFLMRNVHDDAPEVFETRWVMSYLRGPLTRDQIKVLMDPVKRAMADASDASAAGTSPRAMAAPTVAGASVAASASAASAAPEADAAVAASTSAAAWGTPASGVPPAGGTRPVLPPDIPQQFLPIRGTRPAGAELHYEPGLLGAASVRFTDAKMGLDEAQHVTALTPLTSHAVPVDWEKAEVARVALEDLESAPAERAQFGNLPPAAIKAKNYDGWKRDFAAWLHRTQTLDLFASRRLKVFSRPDESEGDFRARIADAGHEQRDQAVDKLRQKFAPKMTAIQERIHRAEQAVARESEQVTQQGVQTAISVGATLIGALLGRKAVSASSVGRATTAARGAGRVLKERQDVGRAQETVEALKRELADLESKFTQDAATLTAAGAAQDPLEPVSVRPAKANISVRLVALCWAPQWRDADGRLTPAWR